MSSSIKNYWENRAAESGGQRTATTDDVHLRELEIATIVDTLKELTPQPRTLLDAGCGDSHTTIGIARALPKLRATGIDFSAHMVGIANQRLMDEADLTARVAFFEGDVTQLEKELTLYSPLVCAGSYLVVLDTVIDDMPRDFFPNRPWGPRNNPKTAVHQFLAQTDRFEIDKEIENKLLLTVAPDGYLKCVKD
jgi:SAM-dependent methyltransferase